MEKNMRSSALVALLLSGCAYQTTDYVTGEGSVVCVTTERLSSRVQEGWSGEVVSVEESFSPEEKAWVNVIFHHAVGKDCDRIEFAECTLGFDGSDIKVEASAEISFAKNREKCDGPVEPLVASCQTVALEEDTWTFQYGEMDLAVDVPSTVETPCLDLDPPRGCSTVPGGTGVVPILLAMGVLRRRRTRG